MRARLLQAAYHLFAVHGADLPTIEDVLAEAGVSRGTFYNHFDTRDDLFRAVADDVVTGINALITAAEQGIDDPVARIAISFRMFVHFATVDPARGWILLRTMPLVGSLNSDMRTHVHDQFRDALASGRLEARSLETTIDLGLGMMVMTIRRVLVEEPAPDPIVTAVEALLVALGLDPAEATRIANWPVALDALPLERVAAPGSR